MQVLRTWAARGVQWVGVAGVIGLSGAAQAGDYDGSPQVAEFVSEMTRDYGFAGEQLMGLFRDVNRKQSILDAISRPAERVKQWKEYRPIFISDARISRGVDFWNKHAEDLARAEKEYGVPAEIIVSIIGVETFFGRNTGEQQVDPLSLTGSYAGAMGLPQFMPSSFRAYAVDFDGDGHINIWSDPTDAIGSVASYFKQHGWVTGEPVVSVAEINDESAESAVTRGVDPTMSLGELRARGWRTHDALRDDQKVTAMRFVGDKGIEYWVGLPNFYVITRYNRSAMYAMAVYQLAGEIARARGAH